MALSREALSRELSMARFAEECEFMGGSDSESTTADSESTT
jgi:hypothetical protein